MVGVEPSRTRSFLQITKYGTLSFKSRLAIEPARTQWRGVYLYNTAWKSRVKSMQDIVALCDMHFLSALAILITAACHQQHMYSGYLSMFRLTSNPTFVAIVC
eukprot:6209522-Amphidinium_carterae.1